MPPDLSEAAPACAGGCAARRAQPNQANREKNSVSGVRINTNISLMVAQRRVNAGFAAQNAAFTRLSTGSRIYRAKDDPAGLIASELLRSSMSKMRAEVRAMERTDLVASTAEASLAEVSDLLVQAESLVLSAANTGGTTADERDAMKLELDSIFATIDRIGDTTKFNGQKLLDGSMSFGAGDDSIAIGTISSRALGLSGLYLADSEQAQDLLKAASRAVSDQRARLGAFQKYSIDPMIRSTLVAIENTAAAESYIRDADIAVESAELIRAQIITEASILAFQVAGTLPQIALQLLNGVRR